MNASRCPLCLGSGLVSRADAFVPEIKVHEPCERGCQIPFPEYPLSYDPFNPTTWPDWFIGTGESQVQPWDSVAGMGADSQVKSQT